MPERSLTYDDILAQIRAEIGAVYNGNITAFADAAHINRQQMHGYLKGKDMGALRLLRCIEAFGLSEDEFMKRARERAGLRPKGDDAP